MVNPAVLALVAQTEKALKGKPAWGHTLCIDFKADGVFYVYANNDIAEVDSVKSADCVLHLNGIGTLNDMLSKKETPTEEWWSGNLSWDGNRSIAEQFVALIQGSRA